MTTNRREPVVLIIDDDIVMRMLAREALEQAGFAVHEADDGREGLAVFRDVLPDAVLLDVIMPVLDGFDTCVALRKLEDGAQLPILMMTGLDDADSINRVYEAGATDFITKPIALPMLGHRVKYVLRSSRAFRELKESQERLSNAQRIAQLGNWEWDLATDEVRRSEEVSRILGCTPEKGGLARDLFLDVVHAADRQTVNDAVHAALRQDAALNIEFRIVRPDGEVRTVHKQAEVVRDGSGQPIRLQGTLQDVTERRRAEEQIHQLALYDSLTGLPNRHLFREQLRRAITQSTRVGDQLVVMSIDLDRFKRVNETLGHEVGDRLLQEAGKRIVQSVRQSDLVAKTPVEDKTYCIARQVGDEFSVVLPDLADARHAAKVARRILDVLSKPFTVDKNDIVLGASVGIAVHPLDGEDSESLLRNADAARNYAKNQCKNCYHFYNCRMNVGALAKLSLEGKLHQALERNELSLHYQPKLALATRRIVGVEALIRWRHPELGMVSPADFIPLSEETDLIMSIGEWTLKTACAQIAAWRDTGVSPVPIAVNLSARQFQQENICDIVRSALREHAVPPHLLELEITESAAMKNAEAASAILGRLKATGVSIAIDDFGTGYSSLSYLKRFPIDSLKIDRSFVTELPVSQDDATIVNAVIRMAQALRLKIVAEGVETEAQRDFLAASGCDQIQGYLVSKPLCAKECEALLVSTPWQAGIGPRERHLAAG